MSTYTPSELVDLPHVAFKAINLKKTKKKLVFANLQLGKATPILSLRGSFTTNQINYDDKYKTYSFGIALEHNEDHEALKAFADMVKEADESGEADAYELNDKLSNEVIYLKLKTEKNKAFTADANIKLVPGKMSKNIYSGAPIDVTVGPVAWFNVEEKTCGLSFTVKHIKFIEAEKDK